jgi:hypothetical protein
VGVGAVAAVIGVIVVAVVEVNVFNEVAETAEVLDLPPIDSFLFCYKIYYLLNCQEINFVFTWLHDIISFSSYR